MDLSNLSSDLPPTKPVDENSINDLNRDLTAEFKNAAKSVAALYRLSNTKNSILRYKGYLDCLDDLLEIISVGGDVENWALTKKAELGSLSGQNSTNNVSSTVNTAPPVQEGKEIKDNSIPTDYEFSMDIPAPYHFPPSFPPLSVNHSETQYQPHSRKKTMDKEEAEKDDDESLSGDDYIANRIKRRMIDSMADKKTRTTK